MKEIKKQKKPEGIKREKLTRQETLKRMKSFPKRQEKFIAAIRKSADRDLHS